MTATHDKSGALSGFVKVTRDLTERRLADEMVRQSEQRLRLLVDTITDYAIFMLDPDGRIATWNGGAERIFGYRSDEVIHRHFSLLYRSEDVESGAPARDMDIAAREGRYEQNEVRVRKNGDHFCAELTLGAIRDPATRILRGFTQVTRDLTDRYRMEELARSAEEQAKVEHARAVEAETALRLRDDFMCVAAHELRTPLTALTIHLEGRPRF